VTTSSSLLSPSRESNPLCRRQRVRSEFLQTANESALVNARRDVARIARRSGRRRNKVAGELIDLVINPLGLPARPQSRAWYFFFVRDAQMYALLRSLDVLLSRFTDTFRLDCSHLARAVRDFQIKSFAEPRRQISRNDFSSLRNGRNFFSCDPSYRAGGYLLNEYMIQGTPSYQASKPVLIISSTVLRSRIAPSVRNSAPMSPAKCLRSRRSDSLLGFSIFAPSADCPLAGHEYD